MRCLARIDHLYENAIQEEGIVQLFVNYKNISRSPKFGFQA